MCAETPCVLQPSCAERASAGPRPKPPLGAGRVALLQIGGGRGVARSSALGVAGAHCLSRRARPPGTGNTTHREHANSIHLRFAIIRVLAPPTVGCGFLSDVLLSRGCCLWDRRGRVPGSRVSKARARRRRRREGSRAARLGAGRPWLGGEGEARAMRRRRGEGSRMAGRRRRGQLRRRRRHGGERKASAAGCPGRDKAARASARA